MASLAEYIHSKGLLFGIYTDVTLAPCVHGQYDSERGRVPGSYGHYERDAATFAKWGVDYVKADFCTPNLPNGSVIRAEDAYPAFSKALNATGRPVMYDVVLQVAHARETPSYDLGYLWSPEVYGKEAVQHVANMWWSLPVNKFNCWSCCVSGERIVDDSSCTSLSGTACRRGLLPMLDAQDMGTPGFSSAGHWDYGGPGGWNHLDQLAVCTNKSWYGPGFTHTEQVAQMSLWSVLASPLIISMDVRNVSAQCIALVTNPRAIAVHQDALGAPGRRLKNIGAVPSTSGWAPTL
jgi:alpha-galactosidase